MNITGFDDAYKEDSEIVKGEKRIMNYDKLKRELNLYNGDSKIKFTEHDKTMIKGAIVKNMQLVRNDYTLGRSEKEDKLRDMRYDLDHIDWLCGEYDTILREKNKAKISEYLSTDLSINIWDNKNGVELADVGIDMDKEILEKIKDAKVEKRW